MADHKQNVSARTFRRYVYLNRKHGQKKHVRLSLDSSLSVVVFVAIVAF